MNTRSFLSKNWSRSILIGVTAAATGVLFVIGFCQMGSWLLSVTHSVHPLAIASPWETVNFYASIGFLLALCAPAATILFSVYSHRRPLSRPILGYLGFLCVSIASAMTGVAFHLLNIWYIQREIIPRSPISEAEISTRLLHYFEWGFVALLSSCILIAILLLMLPDHVDTQKQGGT